MRTLKDARAYCVLCRQNESDVILPSIVNPSQRIRMYHYDRILCTVVFIYTPVYQCLLYSLIFGLSETLQFGVLTKTPCQVLVLC